MKARLKCKLSRAYNEVYTADYFQMLPPPQFPNQVMRHLCFILLNLTLLT